MISRKKRQNIIIIFVALLIFIIAYAVFNSGYESTDNASIDSHIAPIVTKVPGYIKRIYVLNNQQVKAGDLLLQMDTTDYQIALDKANAELEAAQARMDSSTNTRDVARISAPSGLDSARFQVKEAEANWEKALANLRRYREMKEFARSRKQLEDANSEEKARAVKK